MDPSVKPNRVRRRHGGVRGADMARGSTFLDGRFGRLFRALPAAVFSDTALSALGTAMTSVPENPPTAETDVDAEENPGIPAGYTYLGQFIDHDLTFDPSSSLQKQNDPDALVDYRTPRFDLDNVYGRGPDDQPYLYEDDGLHLQLGTPLTGNPSDPNTKDLPRHQTIKAGVPNPERALIGDPRNDENVIVSQLQGIMLRFHNHMVNENAGATLSEVQRIVRWHYQYVVLNDFLPTIVGQDMVDSILPHFKAGLSIDTHPPKLKFYKFKNEPFMPLEFSVAAYRFGHSMIRPIYRLNTTLGSNPPAAGDNVNGRQMIFDPAGDDLSLTGFRKFPSVWAIDWSLFFDMGNDAPLTGVNRLQRAYKIDTSLVSPLGALPPSVASNPASLAQRNLLRGVRLGLPSGQAVARAMGVPVIADKDLKIGKATADPADLVNASIVDVSPEFKGKAPLWYYILAEAQQQFHADGDSTRLGPVGGRIVAETFVGLMLGDAHSFLSQDPSWQPVKQDFKMADLIRMATSA